MPGANAKLKMENLLKYFIVSAFLSLIPFASFAAVPTYLMFQKDGELASDTLGLDVAVGDVCGGGTADFAAITTDSTVKARLYAYDGSTGNLCANYPQTATGVISIAIGDVDGDNDNDIILGSASTKRFYVFDGPTAVQFASSAKAAPDAGDLLFGNSVAAGDVNADGYDDIVVGAPGYATDTGRVYVFSGADPTFNTILYTKNGELQGDQFGWSVSAGYINNDNYADFIVGARYGDPGGLTGAGSVYVYDGSTGNLLFPKISGATANNRLGWSVSALKTVYDGAGSGFIAGMPSTGAGKVYVYDSSGNELFNVSDGIPTSYFGKSVSTAGGDVEGAGGAIDFVVGVPDSDNTYVYDGSDGTLIYSKSDTGQFGWAVAGGDVDGDGEAEIVVGARMADPGALVNAGSVFVYGVDYDAPVITDNQPGDNTWRSIDPGAIYDVDFADPAPGNSNLDYIKYSVWSGAGMTGVELIGWATIASGINAQSYTAEWGVNYASLTEGTNYVSVKAYDMLGNVSDVATDVFYVKIDTSTPTVVDNQTGDDTWRIADPGTIYDVDFSDTGSSLLNNVQYTVWNSSGMGTGTGTELITWTDIATGINAASYTVDWGVDFDSLADGTNYISVRSYDNAGNVSSVATDAFYVKKDASIPVVADNQTGDDIWRIADPGAVYDVDFSDSGTLLNDAQYKVWSSSGMGAGTGTELITWTDIATGINAASYTADWGVDFSSLTEGINYISVRASDNIGHVSPVATDVFYVKKDVSMPIIIDNQSGDDTWRPADPGAIYDVDFSDTGSSLLNNVQYTVWNSSGMGTGTGTELITWTDIAAGINAASYTIDWSVDFASLTEGTNYISVRCYDNAGNPSSAATDVFYVKKDVTIPAVVDNQTGDDTWRIADTGVVYDVDFSDSGGSLLDNVQYTVWSSSGMGAGTGTEMITWTDIATGINAASYTADWGVDFASLTGGINYISVRGYDNAGNVSSTATDAFYVKKDTTIPSTVGTINDGSGADEDYTTDTSQLSANWSASVDAESGIVRYLYAIGTTAGATDVVDWTDNGTATYITHTGLSLTQAQTYFFTIMSENDAGLQSIPASSDGQTVDTSAPTAPAAVNDGTGADITYAASATQLSANWSSSSDPESGIARYWYAIGSTAGATDVVDWTDNGTATAVTKTGLTLTNGQTYYFTVKAENGAGLLNGATDSDGQEVETTSPLPISYVYDGTTVDIDYLTNTTQLSANWAASSDPESGVVRYLYAIGTSAGATDVVDWTDNGTATGVTKTGLSLTGGQIYYFTVKSENGAGLESAESSSDGQTVDSTEPVQVSFVYDGTGDDIDNITSTTELSANWAASSDPESGVVRYLYAIGTDAGATDVVDWTDNGTATGVAQTGLSLS
ncbi:MAG: FG-GAP-like repeat-containing protein, partial [bacterium]